ncbi:MAG TPA: right-handed parallel beta-helix repeat-containing protein [Nitrososphaera sp.]|nr:right-handed parallel beta-helix repeat-containing protein [Nitrososphaera sp.]
MLAPLTEGFGQQRSDSQACASYSIDRKTILVECDASIETIQEDIADERGADSALAANGTEWILNADILVVNGATLTIDTAGSRLKIMGAHGIIIDGGRLHINNSVITSWSVEGQEIGQTSDGSIERAFVRIKESHGVFISNSEFGYLGYNEPGKRGFDVFGEPSRNITIVSSKFHHMWMAFYSSGASDIIINGNEYYDNVKYALDPHTGTTDMVIVNNHLHHNPIGVICSLDCRNILIEENRIHDNIKTAIFLSRNMHNSVVRNNTIYDETVGIIVSESRDNEITENKIEAIERGISLFSPTNPDDGVTRNNIVRNNSITGAERGIASVRSQDNVLENNGFTAVGSEYYMSRGSSITIRNQTFDSYEIEGERGTNVIRIEDSGTILIGDGEVYDTNMVAFNEELNYDTLVVDSR